MQNRKEIREFLLAYIEKRDFLGIEDMIKLLYQSAFGCNHFCMNEEAELGGMRLELEYAMKEPGEDEIIEPILGRYARVNIVPYAASGMRLETLARMFVLTSREEPRQEEKEWFLGALKELQLLTEDKRFFIRPDVMKKELQAYRESGCPSVHHSRFYSSAYHPAYRVIRRDYAQLLSLFAAIDRLLEGRERVIVAIDGNSGAGKSTLADLLCEFYEGATLVHMDDFFLQMHQRTEERLNTPGGNVDHERFLAEVLAPMRRGETMDYRPFDCACMEIGEGKRIAPGKLCIVEGSYSLHPQLEAAYDLKIVLHISPKEQKERILMRNGSKMLERFVNEWIPMENRYFEKTHIENRCDLRLDVKLLDGGAASYIVQKTEERG